MIVVASRLVLSGAKLTDADLQDIISALVCVTVASPTHVASCLSVRLAYLNHVSYLSHSAHLAICMLHLALGSQVGCVCIRNSTAGGGSSFDACRVCEPWQCGRSVVCEHVHASNRLTCAVRRDRFCTSLGYCSVPVSFKLAHSPFAERPSAFVDRHHVWVG